MQKRLTLFTSLMMCLSQFSNANAITNTRMTPQSAGCLTDARGIGSTFPQNYSIQVDGRQINRKVKAGLQLSDSCRGFWGVYEGPIDSIISLEFSDGTIVKGMMERPGMKASFVVRDYSGSVKSCIAMPFAPKRCSKEVQVNY
jgi:hypothetical protein